VYINSLTVIIPFSEEMAPAYKLTYFPVEALAEPIRFLFSYGGIEFEDVRFDRENWPQIKPSSYLKRSNEHSFIKNVADMPFGQVPILEHNGKVAHQSISMARYMAKKVKLVGSDDWEDLEIDAVVDTVNDLRQSNGLCYDVVLEMIFCFAEIALYSYETDEAIKESRKEPLFKETIPYYLQRLDAIVKANNGHLAVGKVELAKFLFKT
jgi:glutathione S-transferase